MKNQIFSRPWIQEVYELVKVIDLHLSIPPEKKFDSELFRIEILKSLLEIDKYYISVWRAENFRLQSTHPQSKGVPQDEPSDELIWVEDYFFWTDSNEVYAPNLDTVLKKVINIFESRLKHCGAID